MNNVILALTVYDSLLVAGGSFTTANGMTANRIAAWNGIDWSPLGSGTDFTVYSLTSYDSCLIIGGSFNTAGGVPVNNIASWDGDTWLPLGDGLNGSFPQVHAFALAVHNDKLVAGGTFTTSGSIETKYIALWDGNYWSSFGSGMAGEYPYVEAFTEYNDNLIAGGDFTIAGGMVSAYIAQWTKKGCCNMAGDANNDGTCNIGDRVFLINYIFRFNQCDDPPGNPIGCPPECTAEGDANADGAVNIGDEVYLGNYIFRPATSPAPQCGPEK